MPKRKIAHRELADFFALLGHPLRLAVVLALSHGERDVGTLATETSAAQTAVSQALARLRAARIVRERREGRHVFYRLTLAGLPPWLDGAWGLLADEAAQLLSVQDAIATVRRGAVDNDLVAAATVEERT
jgi:DNA-binding transcriptional ArsR family regulator